MCKCPYFNMEERKCMLWKTYQDNYIIELYCLGPYPDSYTNCANYKYG